MSFIAGIGSRKDAPQISDIVEQIFEHKSDEGHFQLPMNIPKHFGGSGSEKGAGALCDTSIIVYSIAKLGLKKDERVQKAVKYLASIIQVRGWHCFVSKELGRFGGTGRKEDLCPYANLEMLKMLAQFDGWKHSNEAHVGAECLLDLLKRSLELRPYMFYMGTDFQENQSPLHMVGYSARSGRSFSVGLTKKRLKTDRNVGHSEVKGGGMWKIYTGISIESLERLGFRSKTAAF